MKKYSWLLFDADGTLFDFDHAESSALKRTIEDYGYAFKAEHLSTYRDVNQKIWHAFEQGELAQDVLKTRRFELFFEAANLDAHPGEFSRQYLAHLAEGSQLLEGAEQLIRNLAKSYRLLIITNGLKEVQRPRFMKSAIHSYFDEFIISGEIGSAKPEPEIFDAAFAAMGYPPKSETIMIGDSLSSDIAGGSRYGIDTCWFNPRGNTHSFEGNITYEIHDLDELRKILTV